MSVAGPTGLPSICSGAIQPSDPSTMPERVRFATASSARAIPKSITRGPE